MTTYLERYRNGEREQVWAELLALGTQVREEPLFSDALAIAISQCSISSAPLRCLQLPITNYFLTLR